MNKKSQIISIDFIISIVIITFLIVFLFSKLSLYDNKYKEKMYDEKLTSDTLLLSDILVSSTGSPIGWNSTNVRVIGLSNADRVIDKTKLQNLKSIPYEDAKAIMNIENYDFQINLIIQDHNNTFTYGIVPDSQNIKNIRRLVLFEDEKAIFELKVW